MKQEGVSRLVVHQWLAKTQEKPDGYGHAFRKGMAAQSDAICSYAADAFELDTLLIPNISEKQLSFLLTIIDRDSNVPKLLMLPSSYDKLLGY